MLMRAWCTWCSRNSGSCSTAASCSCLHQPPQHNFRPCCSPHGVQPPAVVPRMPLHHSPPYLCTRPQPLSKSPTLLLFGGSSWSFRLGEGLCLPIPASLAHSIVPHALSSLMELCSACSSRPVVFNLPDTAIKSPAIKLLGLRLHNCES